MLGMVLDDPKDRVVNQRIALDAEADQVKLSAAAEDNVGAMLAARFEEWADAKREVEDDMIEDLRAFHSQYTFDQKQRIETTRSNVYFGITRTKIMAAYSRLVDLLMQGGEAPWSIDPTPVPELSQEQRIEINQIAYAEVMAVAPGLYGMDKVRATMERSGELQAQIRQLIRSQAEEAADNMTREIEDQLTEEGFDQHFKTALLEMCILGNGCLKGATMKIVQQKRWNRQSLDDDMQETANWSIQASEKAVPRVSAPSVFNLYPDPYATCKEDMVGLYERHIMIRSQLISMVETGHGFDEKVLWEILAQFPNGNHVERQYETDRRHIAGLNTARTTSGRYEVLEYWGDLTGEELEQCGCKVKNREAVYPATVWICANRVLKAQVNPFEGQDIPYHIIPYERVPHQFWGISIARMMRDSQETLNTAIRAFLDNVAISSGPQVEVNVDLLAPGEDATSITPWKAWLRRGGDATTPLLRFYQPQNHSGSLHQVIDMFRRFVDEETSLPSYTHGDQGQGLNKTATGMSMLMGAANVAIKSVVKNVDDFGIRPLIRSLYDWNMQWNPKDEIKGDLMIDARGSTVLISKEVQSNRLIQFLQMTGNPIDLPLTDRRYLLGEVAKSLEIDVDKAIPDEQNTPNPALNPGGGGAPVAGAGPESAPGSMSERLPPSPAPALAG